MSVEIPLIDAISSKYSPPKDNKLHNSKPTCSSRLCHFSASQLEWSFLLYCLLLKPRAWLPGWRPTRLDDLDFMAATRERNQLMSHSAFVWKFTFPRARRWWRLHHSRLTVMMASFCSAVTECRQSCVVQGNSRLFHLAMHVRQANANTRRFILQTYLIFPLKLCVCCIH